jgi:membrane-bound lytic murein transglycosylase MltF
MHTGKGGSMRRQALVSPLVLLVLVLAGCNGGTVDQHALDKDSESIDSLACEGALLAHEIANTASLTTFSRTHAGELYTRARNFEDALSTRPTTPGIEKAVREEAKKAGQIAELYDQLAADSSNPELAAKLELEFKKQGGCK